MSDNPTSTEKQGLLAAVADALWIFAECEKTPEEATEFIGDLETSGYAIVPVEPTSKMEMAGQCALASKPKDGAWEVGSDDVWAAMIEARPR